MGILDSIKTAFSPAKVSAAFQPLTSAVNLPTENQALGGAPDFFNNTVDPFFKDTVDPYFNNKILPFFEGPYSMPHLPSMNHSSLLPADTSSELTTTDYLMIAGGVVVLILVLKKKKVF